MERNGLDTEEIIKLRRHIHKNAEGAFNEFKTQKTMKDMLTKFGIKESEIKVCAGTGLVVDIKGTGPMESETKEGKVNVIALRADMDALPMPENNPELDY